MFGFSVNGLLSIVSILNILYGNKVSYTVKLITGFIIESILMISLPLTAEYAVHGDNDSTAFYLCIILLLIFGIISGFVQNTIFGLAGMLPPKYMGAVMFGNGLSGITCNLINCITLVAFPDNLFLGSIVYFVIAAGVLILCLFCKLILRKNKFCQYYI